MQYSRSDAQGLLYLVCVADDVVTVYRKLPGEL